MQLKTVLFAIGAAGLPVLFLLVLEGVLRLAGVAELERTVFQRVPGRPEYVAFNPDYAQRYFQGFRPGVAFTPFHAEKPDDAVRLFVLGGSSTAGFPYQFYNGFPSRLQETLTAHAPGQPIEVINLGLTAVNSYTLWDLKDEIVAAEPDAVLIYAGHNEYYGAFGAGSTVYDLGNRIWLKRLTLHLKRTVLFTLLERVLYRAATEAAADEERTMMARVVREASIPLDGPVFQAGVSQFEANMEEVVATFRRAGVPVFLGTLTSNLADQPPLGEATAAHAAFARGRAHLEEGDFVAARAAFLQAKELDDIRFRAPEAMNETLRRLAEDAGATLVDVAAAVRSANPNALEGAALFTDHLHPTAAGYAVVADAFARALESHPRFASSSSPLPLAEHPIDPIEERHARLTIERLRAGYPFDKTRSPAEEERAVSELLRAALARGSSIDTLAVQVLTLQRPMPDALHTALRTTRSTADSSATMRLYRALLYWQPFNEPLMREAVAFGLGNPNLDVWNGQLALHAAQRTGALSHYNALAAALLRQQRLAPAQHVLDVIERRDADEPVMLYNRARLLVLQGDTLGARRYFDRYRQASVER